MKYTKIYGVWCGMKERCSNPNNKAYHRYGGRGIKVCDEWEKSFISFYNWAIANGYKEIDDNKKRLTIDRIDSNGNYEPNNYRWVTSAEQNLNYSRNHLIEYNGQIVPIKVAAELSDIPYGRLMARINNGIEKTKLFVKEDARSLRWKTK